MAIDARPLRKSFPVPNIWMKMGLLQRSFPSFDAHFRITCGRLVKRPKVCESGHPGKLLKLSKSISIWLDNCPVLATSGGLLQKEQPFFIYCQFVMGYQQGGNFCDPVDSMMMGTPTSRRKRKVGFVRNKSRQQVFVVFEDYFLFLIGGR
jgi:hypothetical protein